MIWMSVVTMSGLSGREQYLFITKDYRKWYIELEKSSQLSYNRSTKAFNRIY